MTHGSERGMNVPQEERQDGSDSWPVRVDESGGTEEWDKNDPPTCPACKRDWTYEDLAEAEVPCPRCEGESGDPYSAQPFNCGLCGGKGKVPAFSSPVAEPSTPAPEQGLPPLDVLRSEESHGWEALQCRELQLKQSIAQVEAIEACLKAETERADKAENELRLQQSFAKCSQDEETQMYEALEITKCSLHDSYCAPHVMSWIRATKARAEAAEKEIERADKLMDAIEDFQIAFNKLTAEQTLRVALMPYAYHAAVVNLFAAKSAAVPASPTPSTDRKTGEEA